MKKGLLTIGIIVGVIFIFGAMIAGTYNTLVSLEEEVGEKLSNISVQLERRADLIPNLINSVKGYISHEQSIIDSVTSARANLVNAKDVGKMAEANKELTTALNNLFVVVENYPELKSNTNFIQLQDELAGTENRISVTRLDYNETVKEYNKTIKSFPTNILAGILGFETKEYFEAKESANEVPEVSFE